MTEREELAVPMPTTEQERTWAADIMKAQHALYFVEQPMRGEIEAALRAGLEWAASCRAALRTQPQAGSVEQVERAAEAMWQAESLRASGRERLVPWSEANPEIAGSWRDCARAALQSLHPDIASLLAEERAEEIAWKAALKSLKWTDTPFLAAAAEAVRKDGFNNGAGYMSRHMCGRLFDAYFAAREAIRSLGSTGGV